MHYFISGHTGFKGSWLTLLLTEAGHTVSGLSLNPEPGSLFEIADLKKRLQHDSRGDVRDPNIVEDALHAAAPDVVIHMAAQPLVRESFARPRFTIETNVNGTLNVLEAVSNLSSVEAQLIVTTDKVYRNVSRADGYCESDALGGDDPYSASKSMADILAQSWIQSFPSPPTAIARAGNVIGGGDVSKDRLLPDLMRSFVNGKPALIRSPSAVRPWQHILDCLRGYLLLVERLGSGVDCSGPWNFGPTQSSFATVAEVSSIAAQSWGPDAVVSIDDAVHPNEAALLTLNAAKARDELNWTDLLSLTQSIEWTVEWTRSVARGRSALEASLADIERFSHL